MSAVTFDTLKFAERLEAGGFTHEQARTAAQAFSDALADEMVTKTYLDARLEATKSDILKWMFGAISFQTIAIIGTVLALSKSFH